MVLQRKNKGVLSYFRHLAYFREKYADGPNMQYLEPSNNMDLYWF